MMISCNKPSTPPPHSADWRRVPEMLSRHRQHTLLRLPVSAANRNLTCSKSISSAWKPRLCQGIGELRPSVVTLPHARRARDASRLAPLLCPLLDFETLLACDSNKVSVLAFQCFRLSCASLRKRRSRGQYAWIAVLSVFVCSLGLHLDHLS